MALWPNAGQGLLILEVSRSHTRTHHSREDSFGRVIARRRDLYLTIHNNHNKHPCLGGIRTHDLSRRAAVDLHLRPRRHWDRLIFVLYPLNLTPYFFWPYAARHANDCHMLAVAANVCFQGFLVLVTIQYLGSQRVSSVNTGSLVADFIRSWQNRNMI